MEKRLIGIVLILLLTFATTPVISDAADTQKPLRVTLEDLGTLQLVAHDLFHVERELATDTENGSLDLSTIFDHGEENIAVGGERRNRENIIVFTTAKKFVSEYQRLKKMGMSGNMARRIVTAQFKMNVHKTFMRLLEDAKIEVQHGDLTMTENLAFRTIHDFLPGEIGFEGERVSIFDPSLKGKVLSKQDSQQLSGPLDGTYDPAIRNIVIFIPPGTTKVIDLLERDSSFATEFGTDFTLEHFLSETADGHFDRGEDVTRYLHSVVGKALGS